MHRTECTTDLQLRMKTMNEVEMQQMLVELCRESLTLRASGAERAEAVLGVVCSIDQLAGYRQPYSIRHVLYCLHRRGSVGLP